MQQSFTKIQTNRQVNEQQKSDLQDQLSEETQLKQVQQLQQTALQAQEAEKNELIAETKGKESNYQGVLAANQKTAAQIRAALFELTGTKAIPFETALQYAQVASAATGIRPAFLLGIITEESNLGENVGTGNWNADMNPTRDKPVFAAITSSLGLDPNSMPVSKKPWYGWGGAMGPAQFIPSTPTAADSRCCIALCPPAWRPIPMAKRQKERCGSAATASSAPRRTAALSRAACCS